MCAWRGVEAPLWKPEHNDICFSSPTTQIPGAELRLSSLVTGTLNGSAILRTSTPLQGIYVSHPTCWANNLSSKSISVFRQKSELKHSLVRGLKGLFLQTDASACVSVPGLPHTANLGGCIRYRLSVDNQQSRRQGTLYLKTISSVCGGRPAPFLPTLLFII